MFDRLKNLLKKAGQTIFGKPEEAPQLEQKNKEFYRGSVDAELALAFEEQQRCQERQEKLKQYWSQFMVEHSVRELSPVAVAIERFLLSVQNSRKDELQSAVEEALKKAEKDVNNSKQLRDRIYDQRFEALDMHHSISIAFLSLQLKLFTCIGDSKLKGAAGIEKATEQENLLKIMSKVFWLRFTYFEKVDSLLRNDIAEKVNEALEKERIEAMTEYRKYRETVYEKLGKAMDVDALLSDFSFEHVAYKVNDVKLDQAYVGVFSILGTLGSVLWKVLLVFLFIFGMPITTMVTIIMNPTWLSYITEDRNPYLLAFASFLSLFFIGLLIVMMVRLFVWNPAVVNSFQQKYRILGSNLNVYVDGYWQPKLEALENQYKKLYQQMNVYFKEERIKISGLSEAELAEQLKDARLLVKFYSGIKIE